MSSATFWCFLQSWEASIFEIRFLFVWQNEWLTDWQTKNCHPFVHAHWGLITSLFHKITEHIMLQFCKAKLPFDIVIAKYTIKKTCTCASCDISSIQFSPMQPNIIRILRKTLTRSQSWGLILWIWSTKAVNPQHYYTLASYYNDQKNYLIGVVSIWILQYVCQCTSIINHKQIDMQLVQWNCRR